MLALSKVKKITLLFFFVFFYMFYWVLISVEVQYDLQYSKKKKDLNLIV